MIFYKTNLIWIGIAYISQITVFDFRICNLLSRINTIVYTSSKILYQNCGSYKYFESFMNKNTIFFIDDYKLTESNEIEIEYQIRFLFDHI